MLALLRRIFRSPWGPRLLLGLALLTPLLAIIHIDERGLWTLNRSLFISPDEFSYVLTAESLANGQGIRLQGMSDDTFYPPGFSGVLAVWGKVAGFDIRGLHIAVGLQQCVAIIMAWLVIGSLLAPVECPRLRAWLAAILTLLYGLSGHVLENVTAIFSEPLFTALLLGWILLALRRPRWYTHIGWTLAMAALAVAVTAVRSAGIVCIATTLAYPGLVWIGVWWRNSTPTLPLRTVCRAGGLILLVAAVYYVGLHRLSPERSLFSGAQSRNSYTRQLLAGLTDGFRTPWYKVDKITVAAGQMMLPHATSLSLVFVPPPRESPKFGVFNIIAKLGLLLALLGYIWRLWRAGDSRMPELAVALYISLYLVWPFDFVRFWIPLLPVLLAYLTLVTCGYGSRGGIRPRRVALTLVLLGSLLVLHGQDALTRLQGYQRRINLVSDALANGAAAMRKAGGTANNAVCSFEPFTMRYYTHMQQFNPRRDENGRWESVPDMIRRAQATQKSAGHVFVASYFDLRDWDGFMRETQTKLGPTVRVVPLYRYWNIVAVWEVVPVTDAAAPSASGS
ncbi:MAG: hypothetical protein WCJ97_03690 [Phycisphaerae bacterium]